MPSARTPVLAGVLALALAAGCGAPKAGGAGPCDNIACSGHGQCAVVGGTQAVCVCDAGYEASGLACVLPGTGPTVPPGGASLGLTVPSPQVELLSADGRYLAYASMAATADPSTFTLGHEKVRALATGHEVDLGPATLHCGFGGCGVWAEPLRFATAPGVDLAYVRKGSSPAVLDLKTGQQTVLPVPAKNAVLAEMPDLSGFFLMKQTYGGSPGSVSFLVRATGKVTRLAVTAADPYDYGDVALEGTGTAGVVAAHLDVSGAGQALDLWTVPGLARTEVAAVDAFHLGFAGKRLLYLVCGSHPDCNAGEVHSVPLSGSPVADLGGPGDWEAPSPKGTFVLVGQLGKAQVVRVDGTGQAMAVPGKPTQVQWRDDTHFDYLDADTSDLESFDTETGKATRLATGVARYHLLPSGLSMIARAPATVTVPITVEDGTTKGSLDLTAITGGRVLRGGKTTGIGRGNLADWQFAGPWAVRTKLYFDVLNGFTPAKDDGTVVFQP